MRNVFRSILIVCVVISCNNAGHKEQIKKFSNGKVEQRLQTLNGVLDGVCEGYYENGILEVKGQYKNGKEDGIWIHCYPSQKLQDYTVYKNGKILESISWDTMGNIILRNGNGYRLSMDCQGEIISLINYKNYRPDGKYEEIWLSNKKKLCEGYYRNGRPVGKWVYRNENGSLNRVEEHPE